MKEKINALLDNVKEHLGTASAAMKERSTTAASSARVTARGAAGAMKRKAQQTAAVVKVNADIYTQKGKIKNLETELGRLYYEAVAAGNQPDEDAMAAILEQLDEANRQIAADRARLEEERAARHGDAVISENGITETDFASAEDNRGLTLVVLAAGIGSRFGAGIKQLTPIGPNGELIIDYSIHDAMEAGYTDVVFIVRREIEPLMRELIGDRIAAKLGEEHVKYAYQEIDAIPEGAVAPETVAERKKPWGTGHAVLSCKDIVTQPFTVINADDYYGKAAFRLVADFLKANYDSRSNYCMAGFVLKNTLSDFGTVTRGLCTLDEASMLTDVTETFRIAKTAEGAESDGRALDPESLASMNFWGFTPDFLETMDDGFRTFLRQAANPLKDEYLLPSVIDEQIKAGKATVKCIKTDDSWFGVTYAEDKALAAAALEKLIQAGLYPEKLWDE